MTSFSSIEARALTYMGLDIIIDRSANERREDWSEVRSPARARRRMKKHPQRINVTYAPCAFMFTAKNVVIMHPTMFERLKAATNYGRPTQTITEFKTFKYDYTDAKRDFYTMLYGDRVRRPLGIFNMDDCS